MEKLKDLKVAILVANGFEEVEFTKPKEALEKEGARVEVVSPEKGKVKAWNKKEWGNEYNVDVSLDKANPEDYDALLLPGGVMNPDNLRTDVWATVFVKKFFESDKPVAAICHAPQLLIETGIVEGRELTSFESIKTDLKNAGGIWLDKEVVVDRGLVTSRKPDDIPAFNEKMIEEFARKNSTINNN